MQAHTKARRHCCDKVAVARHIAQAMPTHASCSFQGTATKSLRWIDTCAAKGLREERGTCVTILARVPLILCH